MKNILFVLQLPPPVHGASLMNALIKHNNIINSQYNCKYINLSPAKDLQDIGKSSVGKYFKVLNIYRIVFLELMNKKYDCLYISLSVTKIGFLKDSIVILLGKLVGAKIVIHLHGKGIRHDYDKSCTLFKKYYEFIYNKSYVIHLSNKLIYDTGQFNGIIKRYILPNAVESMNIKRFTKNRTAKTQFLFLSNMNESKGVITVLEAIDLLKNQNVNFHVNFVGKFSSEKFKEQFNNLIEKLELQKYLHYLGPKYGEEKYQAYADNDVFIFPTYDKEAFGIVNLEAMQFLLPIISTKVGAIPEIINDGVTGYLIEQKNAEELAEKMEKFIENPSLAITMGESGREKFLKEYTVDKFESNLTTILKDVLNDESVLHGQ